MLVPVSIHGRAIRPAIIFCHFGNPANIGRLYHLCDEICYVDNLRYGRVPHPASNWTDLELQVTHDNVLTLIGLICSSGGNQSKLEIIRAVGVGFPLYQLLHSTWSMFPFAQSLLRNKVSPIISRTGDVINCSFERILDFAPID